MTEAQAAVPAGVDPTKPSVARIYDYLLGGSHNYEVDRAAGEQLREMFPPIEEWAWGNRGFHQRAARWLAGRAGITQFIDIGSGLPTQNNTHQVVGEVNPDANVVYADLDPMVGVHARSLLGDTQRTAFISGDFRNPDELLNNPELRALIDFDQPVALMLTAILHFVSDDADPWGLIRSYFEALPAGSYLALSHATHDRWPAELLNRADDIYKNANERPRTRTKADVERLFDGLELVPPYEGAEPAVTYGGLWGAEDPEAADDDSSRALYVGVARKP